MEYPARVGGKPLRLASRARGEPAAMTSADEPTIEGDRAKARADELLSEEVEAGSDDPLAQAEAILEESDEREENRVDPPGQGVEHRTSAETVDPEDQPPKP
jgi:hypothetical protein